MSASSLLWIEESSCVSTSMMVPSSAFTSLSLALDSFVRKKTGGAIEFPSSGRERGALRCNDSLGSKIVSTSAESIWYLSRIFSYCISSLRLSCHASRTSSKGMRTKSSLRDLSLYFRTSCRRPRVLSNLDRIMVFSR